jgi:HSP20 family protein
MLLKTRNNGRVLPSIFDEFFNDARLPESDLAFSSPDFNVYETDKEFIIEAAVPGFEKKDFEVEVKDNVLSISGSKEKEEENKDQEKKYYYKGFCYGNFKKSYSLPENVNIEKISAAYDNGIMRLNIPKDKEVKLSRQIKIG